jgi:hypothetical protein
MDDKKATILIVSSSILLAAGIGFFGYRYRGIILSSMIDKYNKKKISELHPKYRAKYQNFLVDLKRKGYTPLVTDGIRTYEESVKYYNQDNRNAKPGTSLHIYGVAMDINIKEPEFIGMLQSDEKWKPIVEIAKKNGLEWGGEIFNGYKDRVHFQPKGFPYKGTQLLAMKNEGKTDKNGFVRV